MSSNKRLRLSDPSPITSLASTSSSSIQKRFKYDVFISFRGEDTRKTFVDHLYEALKGKGIYTYKDDERIEQGKTIDNQLIKAIRGSRFFIIVFSQNYASSSWCLDELVEIMECQKTGEQIAYPVFFDVEPTHVRYQSGAFGKAFLENRNKDAAWKWIDALKGAAGLAGWELKSTLDRHEAKFIKKIVQQISLELRSVSFSFDEKLVGMDTRVRDVVTSLEVGTDEVLIKLKFLSLSDSNLTTFDFGMTPNLELLSLKYSYKLKELCMPDTCHKLKHLNISYSKLKTFDLGLTPNLETLCLFYCTHFVKLEASVACPNLKSLDLYKTRLRSLDVELIPNLERLDLDNCDELVEINIPMGGLKKVGYLNLRACLEFTDFKFHGIWELKDNRSSATLNLFGESLDLCPLHPNSNLPKFRFHFFYEEYLPSSVGNIEKLISFGLCACTDFKKFSDIICSLQCLKKLALKCNIPEFPKDLGQLECLEELCLSSTQIKHLPDSICMLKRLKSHEVNNGDLLEKLPEDLGKLECLEELVVSSKKIEYLPDSICMLKRLKELYVECRCLGKLPEDIGQLESLETLDLSSTDIKHLPDSICMLKHLKYLNLEECALLEKLPEDLGRLECLEELDNIRRAGITHLPQSIFGLKGLLIRASTELLQLYDFPSEIETRDW